jgi:hypothetical protein
MGGDTELAPERAFEAIADALDVLDSAKIPAAPFVGKTEAWVSLALKRMIRWAAENGFDRVAWTTGEQQADRYDLSRVFSNIAYRKGVSDNTFEVRAYRKDDENGIDLGGALKASELPDIVGKDVADKIINGDGNRSKLPGWADLSGLQLRVGGEGMREFYDKLVPNIANDVLKKLGGGRVGEVKIDRTDYGKTGRTEEKAKYAVFGAHASARSKVFLNSPASPATSTT